MEFPVTVTGEDEDGNTVVSGYRPPAPNTEPVAVPNEQLPLTGPIFE